MSRTERLFGMNAREEDDFLDEFESKPTRELPPDLGFSSSADLDTTIRGLDKLASHDDTSVQVVGKYKQLLEQQRQYTRERDIQLTKKKKLREQKKISRRQFLIRTRNLVLAAGAVGGLGLAGHEGYGRYTDYKEERRLEKAEILERTHTLGVSPTPTSETGWVAYYPQLNSNVDYVESGFSLVISSGDALEGDEKSFFHNTAIELKKHERRNGDILPKIDVRTNSYYSDGDYIEESEEWVLRPTPDASNITIDSRVLILEKQDTSFAEAQMRYYLQINYIGQNNFAVNFMEKQATP